MRNTPMAALVIAFGMLLVVPLQARGQSTQPPAKKPKPAPTQTVPPEKNQKGNGNIEIISFSVGASNPANDGNTKGTGAGKADLSGISVKEPGTDTKVDPYYKGPGLSSSSGSQSSGGTPNDSLHKRPPH